MLMLTILATAGIPASMAAAQFKVENAADSKPTTTQETITETKTETKDDEQINVVISSDQDGHEYLIKIVNGDLTLAKVDGKEVDADHVKLDHRVVVFVDNDGKTLKEFEIPDAPHRDVKLNGTRGWIVDSDDADAQFFTGTLTPDDGNNQLTVQVAAPPKVMLGINLGEPSKILRKHLKLDDDVHAILVESVIDGLPAQKAGLEDYDVIVSIDGSDQADGETLHKVLSKKDPGDTMNLVVLRGGDRVKLKVKLAAYDAKALGATITYFSDENDQTLPGDSSVKLKLLKNFGNKQFPQGMNKEELKAYIQAAEASSAEAMGDAKRQLLELRDGELIVRAHAMEDGKLKLETHLQQLQDQFPHLQGMVRGHMDELESRLDELENRLDRQIDEMNQHMDRLSDMFDRLMDAMNHDQNQNHDQNEDQDNGN